MASCKKKCGQEQATSNHYPQKSICNLAAESLHWVSSVVLNIITPILRKMFNLNQLFVSPSGLKHTNCRLYSSPPKQKYGICLLLPVVMFQKHRGKSRNQLRHWELVRFTFLIGHVSVQSPRHFCSGQMDVNASSSKNKVRSFESYEFVSCSWDWWFQKGGLDKADKCSWWLLRR